jgi:hypothetical protein
MSGKIAWRQDFLATAKESDWEQGKNRNVRSWLDAPDHFRTSSFYPIAIRVNAVIMFSILIINILSSVLPEFITSLCPPQAFLYFLIPIGLVASRTRTISSEQQKLQNLLELFRKYAGLLDLIESEHFTAPYLNGLKRGLEHGDQLSSQIMKKLTGILWGLELRGNLIVSFLLNTFFLWDIMLMIRLERWRNSYREAFGQWIGVIADFETINSMANL